MMSRKESFGTDKFSLLDKIIYRFRVHQLTKYCDFDHKAIVDVGCWYNAVFLNYIQNQFHPKHLIAFDIKLNTSLLKKQWIVCFEADLNKDFTLPESSDIILCTAVLEHLDNPLVFLKNAYKNLKKWWCLVLTVPSKWSKPVLEFLAFKLKFINAIEIRDHKQYYTKELLTNYLQQAWFEKKHIYHHYFELYMNNFVLVRK